VIKGNDSLGAFGSENPNVTEAVSLESVRDGIVGTAVASVLEGDAEAATAWACEGSHVIPEGRSNAHAGRVILVRDTLAAMPVASNVVPVQLSDHSVMGRNG
jgi:hypothetical protein